MAAEDDMRITLEDARFFCERIDKLVRGPEHEQDLEAVRRYFRAYLHCWKCILHYVRKAKGLESDKAKWKQWVKGWQQSWERPEPGDADLWDHLRETRDEDTHNKAIRVVRQIALTTPIVVFQPGKASTAPRELISCCIRGLALAECLIRDWQEIT